jgi:hypothetical protein
LKRRSYNPSRDSNLDLYVSICSTAPLWRMVPARSIWLAREDTVGAVFSTVDKDGAYDGLACIKVGRGR